MNATPDSFPCLDDIFKETGENSSKSDLNSPSSPSTKKEKLIRDPQWSHSQSSTPTKIALPKTPKRLKTKYNFSRIQNNKAKLDLTKECLQKISFNDEQSSNGDSKTNKETVVDDLNLVDGLHVAGRFLDATRCKISSSSGGLNIFTRKFSDIEKNLDENVLPNFSDFKDKSQLLTYIFNCLAFSRCEKETKGFESMFFLIFKSTETHWFPKADHFLAILAAYGADLNIFTSVLNIDNTVSLMENELRKSFFVPVTRLNENFTDLLILLNKILTYPTFPTDVNSWIVIVCILFLDSNFYLKTNFQITCKDFFNKFFNSKAEKISFECVVNSISNLPLVHSNLKDICYLFDNDGNGRLVISHLVVKFGRKIFNMTAESSHPVMNSPDAFEKCVDIEEILTILEHVEPNLSQLLTDERDLCYSWLLMLNICLSVEYLNQQMVDNVRIFLILFSRWNRLTKTYGMSEDESRLKTIVYSIMNRLDCYDKKLDNPVFMFHQNDDIAKIELEYSQENTKVESDLDSFEIESQ